MKTRYILEWQTKGGSFYSFGYLNKDKMLNAVFDNRQYYSLMSFYRVTTEGVEQVTFDELRGMRPKDEDKRITK